MSWDGAPTRSGLAPIIEVEGEEGATSSSLPSPGIQPAIPPHPSPPPLETFLVGTRGHSSSGNTEKPGPGAVRSLFSIALGALKVLLVISASLSILLISPVGDNPNRKRRGWTVCLLWGLWSEPEILIIQADNSLKIKWRVRLILKRRRPCFWTFWFSRFGREPAN